jgi:hypothetical protein
MQLTDNRQTTVNLPSRRERPTVYRHTVTPYIYKGDVVDGSTGNQGFEIILKPVPGNWRAPAIVRLRALLKAARRAFGFRCISAREIDASRAKPERNQGGVEADRDPATPHPMAITNS